MHSFLFSLLLVVFRSRRIVFYPQIFLKSQIFILAPSIRPIYLFAGC